MPAFKLTIAYDGTDFVGWQRQLSGPSVQGLLEDAFAELDGQPVAVSGAGRTDAGVHAIGQVAGVTLQREIDPVSLVRAINIRLPESVRLVHAVEVGADFHARFNARAKTYRYRLWNGEVISPFERLYAWHVPAPPLDVDALAAAALLLEGSHDFAAFQGAGTTTHGTERLVFSSRVTAAASQSIHAERPALITYDIRGAGFLRHMVRNIMGTLVEVGRGKRPVEWVSKVLASGERAQAGPTAPPQGLFLMSVEY